tara:strand:+ start:1656 stop:1919 length:264 start_codon:yes stop_codon:yes gene_type:complete
MPVMPDFYIFFLVAVVLIMWAAYDVVTPAPENCNEVDMAIMGDQCIPNDWNAVSGWLMWFSKKLVFLVGLVIVLTFFRTNINKRVAR